MNFFVGELAADLFFSKCLLFICFTNFESHCWRRNFCDSSNFLNEISCDRYAESSAKYLEIHFLFQKLKLCIFQCPRYTGQYTCAVFQYWNVVGIYIGPFLFFLYNTSICYWINHSICILHGFFPRNPVIFNEKK